MIDVLTFVLYGIAIIIEFIIICILYFAIKEIIIFHNGRITFNCDAIDTVIVIILFTLLAFIFITILLSMIGVLEFPEPILKEDLP